MAVNKPLRPLLPRCLVAVAGGVPLDSHDSCVWATMVPPTIFSKVQPAEAPKNSEKTGTAGLLWVCIGHRRLRRLHETFDLAVGTCIAEGKDA